MHYSHIGIVYASRMRHIEAIRNIEMCELTYLSCSQIFVNETKNIEAICVFGVPLSIIFLHTTNLLELLLLSLYPMSEICYNNILINIFYICDLKISLCLSSIAQNS